MGHFFNFCYIDVIREMKGEQKMNRKEREWMKEQVLKLLDMATSQELWVILKFIRGYLGR